MKVSRPPRKPLLLFDGDCDFCRRWIVKWKSRTGDGVDYRPYQDASVATDFPELSGDELRRSVHFIEPSGEVTCGAQAVFRTLAAGNDRRPLSLYQHLPGMRWVSEWVYKLVARHRPFFSKITEASGTYSISAMLFVRLLALVYLIAFSSLGLQILGLVGRAGILPAWQFLEGVRMLNPGLERFWLLPTIFWIHASDLTLQTVCWVGAGLSLVVFAGILQAPILFVLWFLYLSLVNVGQDFLSFQWDILLLEAGFLALFVAPKSFFSSPRKSRSPPAFAWWMIGWLLFRLMFESGVWKLATGDPTWRNWTALEYHYETQPLPNPIAWYVAQLPRTFHHVSVAVMFAVELVVPFFLFGSAGRRRAAAITIVLFQVLLFVTGNFAFFNILTAVLCLCTLDDECWHWLGLRWMAIPSSRDVRKWIRLPVLGVVLIVTTMGLLEKFGFSSWPPPLLALSGVISPFHSSNSYGLFGVMTIRRPEIILEGSYDGHTWKEYEFRYKPGDLDRAPPFVAPHQPRLDWQMWFAALGECNQAPWFMDFLVRLLDGSPDVEKLLKTDPFSEKPPHFIRTWVYDYHFTRFSDHAHAWWRRELIGPFCPTVSLEATKA